MILRYAIAGLMALLVTASCHAITLKLDADINLLALDGRKISGSLLKGAVGLELEHGEHQLLFRVEKQLGHEHSPGGQNWSSTPLIATFTATDSAKTITIHLPPVISVHDAKRFDKIPHFSLLDDRGLEIVSRRDNLPKMPNSELEKALIAYNRDGQVASVPRFAQSGPSHSLPNASSSDLVSNDSATRRLLHLWLEQVDSVTRQRLLSWMEALRLS